MSIRLVMTRTTDKRVTLSDRAAIANRAGVDLFLSIHNNAAASAAANGYEDFIYTSVGSRTRQLRDILHKHVSAVFLKHRRANRGKKSANFLVLRETSMPAILLELGFLTNAEDARLLKENWFRQELAQAIFAGIIEAGIRSMCLDPGHGGEQPGAVANGLIEKVVALDICLRLKALIDAHNNPKPKEDEDMLPEVVLAWSETDTPAAKLVHDRRKAPVFYRNGEENWDGRKVAKKVIVVGGPSKGVRAAESVEYWTGQNRAATMAAVARQLNIPVD